MKTANGKMISFMSDDIPNATICPRCNASLEREYHSYFVAIDEEGELETLMMGHNGGFFCPNCPTVVLDSRIVDELIESHAQRAGYTEGEYVKYAVMGIADLDAIPEEKKNLPLGDDDNPIPFIKLEPAPNKSQKRKKHTVGRNDPCPCGSGKKYKKCCMGKNES
ncbi:SEC-C metal-binding domain-containing protein [Candidatus Poribacteria bacterium]